MLEEMLSLEVGFEVSKVHARLSLSWPVGQDICRTLSYFSSTMPACLYAPYHDDNGPISETVWKLSIKCFIS